MHKVHSQTGGAGDRLHSLNDQPRRSRRQEGYPETAAISDCKISTRGCAATTKQKLTALHGKDRLWGARGDPSRRAPPLGCPDLRRNQHASAASASAICKVTFAGSSANQFRHGGSHFANVEGWMLAASVALRKAFRLLCLLDLLFRLRLLRSLLCRHVNDSGLLLILVEQSLGQPRHIG